MAKVVNVSLGSGSAPEISAFAIPEGKYFVGSLEKAGGNVKFFLRAYQQIIDLENPAQTWAAEERHFAPTIYDYRSLSHLNISNVE